MVLGRKREEAKICLNQTHGCDAEAGGGKAKKKKKHPTKINKVLLLECLWKTTMMTDQGKIKAADLPHKHTLSLLHVKVITATAKGLNLENKQRQRPLNRRS
jgi:hypothetical protein